MTSFASLSKQPKRRPKVNSASRVPDLMPRKTIDGCTFDFRYSGKVVGEAEVEQWRVGYAGGGFRLRTTTAKVVPVKTGIHSELVKESKLTEFERGNPRTQEDKNPFFFLGSWVPAPKTRLPYPHCCQLFHSHSGLRLEFGMNRRRRADRWKARRRAYAES